MAAQRSRSRARSADADLGRELRRLLAAMRLRYDHGAWWPARTRFEMMTGAILTQRARWESAAAAARRLRRAGLMRHDRVREAGVNRVAGLLRSCGNHRTKAQRLLALAGFLARAGGPATLASWPTARLRTALLALPGIGPETADVILLYAYRRPAFVADAYALRFLARTGFLTRAQVQPRYAPVHARVTSLLGNRVQDLADLHAVIVEHGKALCGARTRCAECFLAPCCDTGRRFRAGSRAPGR
ncbi:MAG: endonuclease III domain-containing protein [Gammaproteobacteria bacterium]